MRKRLEVRRLNRCVCMRERVIETEGGRDGEGENREKKGGREKYI